MALDLETISNTYFKGYPDPRPHGYIHNDSDLGTPFDEWPEEIKQYYRYDPERAKQLLALTVVVYCLNMFGDAVRDLLDPRLRGGGGGAGLGSG